jgi:glycosyltransferase involved in cell wall biosynthesis
MTPLVSIITPMYNSEAFISEMIHSVINQTHKNWELLLIDDYSTDKTIEIATSFSNRYSNIKLFTNEINQGAANSRNKGIIESKGDFIAFLDADDLWKSEKLEKQLKVMKDENCDVCFSSYELINEQGKQLNKMVKALPFLTYNKQLKSNYIGNLTGIYKSKTLGKITTANLRKRQDWLLWLEAIKNSGKPAVGIQESLAYYRVRRYSVSSNKLNLLKYNFWVYRKGLRLSAIKSMGYFTIFLFEHFFVKSKQTVILKKI